jgi:ribosome modulation factor
MDEATERSASVNFAAEKRIQLFGLPYGKQIQHATRLAELFIVKRVRQRRVEIGIANRSKTENPHYEENNPRSIASSNRSSSTDEHSGAGAVRAAEVQGVHAQGFHDGIEGARKDYENHRQPSVENREEFRHPPVSHHDREAYRDGFRRGYETGVEHLMRGYPHSY